MPNLVRFDRNTLPEPEVSRPAADRLIDGDPVFSTWIIDASDDETRFAGYWAGYWASTPGAWRVVYDEWEYCTLVEGMAVVSEDGGAEVTLCAGDHFIFRPGFRGHWRVVEPVLKTFVVILPPSSS